MASLCCHACGAPVTDDAARIEVCGLHRHTATNPSGQVYVVCCFAAAAGVEVVTNESSEWSWFPGYRWQIENCARCDAHLGWRYSRLESSFHGLIEDHLRPSSSG